MEAMFLTSVYYSCAGQLKQFLDTFPNTLISIDFFCSDPLSVWIPYCIDPDIHFLDTTWHPMF